MINDLISILNKTGVPITEEIISLWISTHNIDEEELEDVVALFKLIEKEKEEDRYETLLRLSRLPSYVPLTFENFNFDRFDAEAQKTLKSLKTLFFIHNNKSVIFTGETGTGKTHLAQAIGNEACKKGIRTYFITFHELNDRLTKAIREGNLSKVVKGLINAKCLIIDEVGKDRMSEENTNAFFHVIDKRCSTPHGGSIIMTSNLDPEDWDSLFDSDDASMCGLDRLLDRAEKFELTGSSYRGRARNSYRFAALDNPLKVSKVH